MTNKLVVILNSLKYQKLRKFYYMKLNFLYQITAASRTTDYGATAPRSPFSLFSTEFVEPPEKNSWVRHCYLHIILGLMKNSVKSTGQSDGLLYWKEKLTSISRVKLEYLPETVFGHCGGGNALRSM